jgi:hypothetical protein
LTAAVRDCGCRYIVAAHSLGAFLLDECMSKTLLGVVCDPPVPVDVMGDFMNEDIIEVKVTDGIAVMLAEFKRMSAEENTGAPVGAITTKRTSPRPLLLAGAREKKYSTKIDQMLARHRA